MRRPIAYYNKLRPIVLDYVEAYQTDFTTHDYNFLIDHDPDRFILAMRPTGTNILSLDDWTEFTAAEKQIARLWLLYSNQRFLYCYQGYIEEIDRITAETMLDCDLKIANDIRRSAGVPLRQVIFAAGS